MRYKFYIGAWIFDFIKPNNFDKQEISMKNKLAGRMFCSGANELNPSINFNIETHTMNFDAKMV